MASTIEIGNPSGTPSGCITDRKQGHISGQMGSSITVIGSDSKVIDLTVANVPSYVMIDGTAYTVSRLGANKVDVVGRSIEAMAAMGFLAIGISCLIRAWRT